MNVFIPFVESYVPSHKIETVLESQGFGKVVSIELHDKKIKKNTELKSANHNYAFVKINLFDSIQGNNMRNNISYNKTTHVMFDYDQKLVHLHLKPHLSVEDRLERGFELHIPDTVQKTVDEVDNTNKNSEPEWYSDEISSSFSFEFGKELPRKLSLILPTIYDFITDRGEMAPRQKVYPSFYDNDIEKQQVQVDYDELMRDIDLERDSFQNYSMLPL